MRMTFDNNTAHLPPSVQASHAESLLLWLEEHPEGGVDLSACEQLHTVIVQVLLAMRPSVRAPPRDPVLASWLVPALAPADRYVPPQS